jgi:hypothetical protein
METDRDIGHHYRVSSSSESAAKRSESAKYEFVITAWSGFEDEDSSWPPNNRRAAGESQVVFPDGQNRVPGENAVGIR